MKTPRIINVSVFVLMWILSSPVASAFANGVPADQRINWSRVRTSVVADKVVKAMAGLHPHLVGETCILLESLAAKPEGGHFQAIGAEMVYRVAHAWGVLGSTPYDPTKMWKPHVRSASVLAALKAASAARALVAECSGSRISLRVVDAEGSTLATATARFNRSERDYLACTQDTSRNAVAWAEEHYDQKVDRGECWDLCFFALKDAGWERAPSRGNEFGRVLQAGESPMPGDILKAGTHWVLIYRWLGEGRVGVLEQNWNGGNENGRKVRWSTKSMNNATIWRPRRSSVESGALRELIATARANAQAKMEADCADAQAKMEAEPAPAERPSDDEAVRWPKGSDDYAAFMRYLQMIVPAGHRACQAASVTDSVGMLNAHHRLRLAKLLDRVAVNSSDRALLREFAKLLE